MINEKDPGASPPGSPTDNPHSTTNPTTPDNTASADILDYLHACFGDLSGRVHAAIGRNPYVSTTGKFEHRGWVADHAAWPGDADAFAAILVAASRGGDVYVCPYLMYADKRTPGGVVGRNLIHVDVDAHVDPQRVRDLGGFAIASGTRGGAHVYVPLAESIPANQHTALEYALKAYFGAADYKVSSNDVLRPPGTLNYKPTVFTPGAPPAAVTWLVRPDE